MDLHSDRMTLPNLNVLKINSERMHADFEQISSIGLTADMGICRLALSREDLEARAWFADRIEEAGFLVHDDDAGNLSGILRCDNPHARTLLIGSHLDTVPNAGRYDGAIGVLAALECLRTIKESNIKLPVHLEIINFTDDEGAWQPMFGSMSLTGKLPPSYLKDTNGDKSLFRAALTRAGINPDHVYRAHRDPDTIAGYIELHVEQGWRLDRAGIQIGVVTGIVGRTSYRVTYRGQAGHAGTTSMIERKDALQGAALFVTRAHALVRDQYPEGVLNCGNLEVKPGATTIIPSEAILTVEARHVSQPLLEEMEHMMGTLAQECAHECRLKVDTQRVNHIPVAEMHPIVTEAIIEACENLQLSYTTLASYASHNAQMMSTFTPSGMFFIPSANGISHNPAEYTQWNDVVNGTNALLHAIGNLALRHSI
jgi:beta-ureidopropionase / N-carbamoyl-L-amino-acid hydrolase